MKKRNYTILKYLFTLVVVILLLYFLFTNKEILSLIRNIDYRYTIALVPVILISKFLSSIIQKDLVKNFGLRLPTFDSLSITILASIMNLLTPFRAGAGVRAVFLKEKFGLKYKDFVTLYLGIYVIIILISVFFGAIGFLISPDDLLQYSASRVLFGFFIVVFIMMLVLLTIFPIKKLIHLSQRHLPEKLGSLKIFIIRLMTGWAEITRNKKLLRKSILITVLTYLLIMTTFYLELRSFGIEVQLSNIMVYSSLSSLSILISLTPGAIGIKEFILIFSQNALGLEATQLVFISLYDRVIVITVLSIFYLLLAVYGRFRENRKIH